MVAGWRLAKVREMGTSVTVSTIKIKKINKQIIFLNKYIFLLQFLF